VQSESATYCESSIALVAGERTLAGM
jgi:hypothetical protein